MQVDDGGVARGRNFPLAHRIREPLPQQTPARAGYARIEQRQQRWPSLATKRLCDFEIAPGCCIERHELVLALHDQTAHMRQRGLLRDLRVLHQRASGSDGQRHFAGTECPQIMGAELFAQSALRDVGIEIPWRKCAHGDTVTCVAVAFRIQ